MPSLPPKMNLFNTTKKFLKNRNWIFPVVRYFTWKLEFVSNILSMIEACFSIYDKILKSKKFLFLQKLEFVSNILSMIVACFFIDNKILESKKSLLLHSTKKEFPADLVTFTKFRFLCSARHWEMLRKPKSAPIW